MVSTVTPWYPVEATAANAAPTLFCYPHGGGDAAAYRNWQRRIGGSIDIAPASLPGRGRRISEPLVPSIDEMAEALVQPTLDRAGGTFALFGHSMGALIAFDLAHRLTALGRPPALLIASGSPPPQPRFRSARSQQLTDDEFTEMLRGLGGVPDGLLDVPELHGLLLPVLRNDYVASETYVPKAHPALTTPLLVLGGGDDPEVEVAILDHWRELTTGPTTVRIFDGGHFFVSERLDEVLETVCTALMARVPGQITGGRQ